MTCLHDDKCNNNLQNDSGEQVLGENQHWKLEIMEYNVCANQTSQCKLPRFLSTNEEYNIIFVSV